MPNPPKRIIDTYFIVILIVNSGLIIFTRYRDDKTAFKTIGIDCIKHCLKLCYIVPFLWFGI